ncbi:hypothetical protein Tco_0808323 [Tanacetum coccineum]
MTRTSRNEMQGFCYLPPATATTTTTTSQLSSSCNRKLIPRMVWLDAGGKYLLLSPIHVLETLRSDHVHQSNVKLNKGDIVEVKGITAAQGVFPWRIQVKNPPISVAPDRPIGDKNHYIKNRLYLSSSRDVERCHSQERDVGQSLQHRCKLDIGWNPGLFLEDTNCDELEVYL